MKKFVSSVISRLRKEPFELDSRVPLLYMLRIVLAKSVQMIYGILLFQHFKCFVSPSSTIKCASMVRAKGFLMIARGCVIDALSTDGIIFGNGVSVGRETSIECTGSLKKLGKGLIVGDNVGMGEKCHYGCAGGIEIGDNTIVGIYVTMHSENHVFSDADKPIREQGVSHQGIKIGRNCWIGAKATILDGAVVGDGCVIAAGAVVRGTFPDNCVIGGIPAKILKSRI